MKKNFDTISQALNADSSKQKTFEKANKRGRTPLKEEERRTNTITLKFNKIDYEILGKLAEEACEDNIHDYIRKVILRKIKEYQAK